METKRRILILDDSEISREMGRFVLEVRGHTVSTVANLVEFERQLKSFEPDLILTDHVMPEIAGADLVRILKRGLTTENLPVVLFSSKPADELARIAAEAGADGYVSKADGIEKVGELVDELVGSIIW